jgi:hypothetical protein
MPTTAEMELPPAPGAVPDPPPRPDAEPTGRVPTPEPSRHARARQGAMAFGAYLLISFLLYGLPVLGDYAGRFAGKGAGDSRIFLWMFAWWPHAISHGQNPVLSHAIFEPHGLNLAWATSIPGPAILMWPLTRAFGPLVSMNIVTMFAPALAAWGAYLCCRRLASWFWPAVLAGYLFGFSSYMTEQLGGHVNLFLIFPVPLAVYLVIRRIDGTLPVGRFVIGLSLLLVLEFSISTEVFATLAFFGAVALFGALVVTRAERSRVVSTSGWTVTAYLLAGLALIPLLTFVLKGAPATPIRPVIAGSSSVDAASFLFPRRSTLIGSGTFRGSVGPALGPAEQGAYLPLPLILMLILAAATLRRDRVTRWVFIFTGIALLFSLGTYLHIEGHRSIPLPWTPFAHLPILQDALPSRFTMFAWLGIAVIAASWMSQTPRPWRRMGLVGLGAVMLLPNVAATDVHTPLEVPAFFSEGQYRSYIPEDHTILYIHADKGGEMLAQLGSHFWFRLAQGHTGPTPASFQREPGYRAIESANPSGLTYLVLRSYIREHNVATVIVADAVAGRWAPVIGSATHVDPIATGGVQVYRLAPVTYPVGRSRSATRYRRHHHRGRGHRRSQPHRVRARVRPTPARQPTPTTRPQLQP